MRATIKKICFWHFFEKNNKKHFKNLTNFTFVSKTLPFRKCFFNEKLLASKKIYIRFGKTS